LNACGFQRLKVFGATDLVAVIEKPDLIKTDQEAYHSYVVLAMKTDNEVKIQAKSDYFSRRWFARSNWSNTGYRRSNTRSSIPLSISQRSDSMCGGRTGWRRWRSKDK
jgi:hypothetical protein